jgi:KDO2-lipid IV(A) lauroyltransferase
MGHRRTDKPTIFVTAHFGNWELAAAAARRVSAPLAVLHNPALNRKLNHQLQQRRKALGVEFVDRKNSVRELIRLLSGGTSIGLVMDQRVDSGWHVDFFGRPASTSMIPARLALKHGYDLIPIRVNRLPGTRFRVTFYGPLKPSDAAADADSQALDLTRQINALFEQWISADPEQWFCFKRRWPRKSESLSAAVGTSELNPGVRRTAPRRSA